MNCNCSNGYGNGARLFRGPNARDHRAAFTSTAFGVRENLRPIASGGAIEVIASPVY